MISRAAQARNRLRRTALMVCVAAVTAPVAHSAAGKGSGDFQVDGRQGRFDVSACVVVEQPGKGARLELVGSREGRQVSVVSNGLNERYERVDQVSIRLDSESPAYFADYRLTDSGWQRHDGQPASAAPIAFSPGRVTVKGLFGQLGNRRSLPAVEGRIEADCPALTEAKIAALRGEAAAAQTGTASGTAAIDGVSAAFEPEMCSLMQMGPGRYVLNLRGEGSELEVAVSAMRFARDKSQQRIQLTLGEELWVATRVQEQGAWSLGNGEEAPGPLLTLDGKHIEAEGEFRLHGSDDRRARGRLEAYCPEMTTLSGG